MQFYFFDIIVTSFVRYYFTVSARQLCSMTDKRFRSHWLECF